MKLYIQTVIVISTLIISSTHAMDSEKKHVMVPLEGFLFRVNTSAALSEMGVSGAASAAYAGGLTGLWRSLSSKGPDQTALATRLFTLLSTMKEPERSAFEPAPAPLEVYWRGIKAPLAIVNWLKSTQPCSKIKEDVLPYVTEKAGTMERTSLHTLANIVFDPEKNASMLVPNEETIALLTTLRDKGHTIHIVDNWNTEAFEQLKRKNPESFTMINGNVHISGDTHTVKSARTCALQDHFFKMHPEVSALNSVFIETEKQHTIPLTDKQFKHVLCDGSDIKKLLASEVMCSLLTN